MTLPESREQEGAPGEGAPLGYNLITEDRVYSPIIGHVHDCVEEIVRADALRPVERCVRFPVSSRVRGRVWGGVTHSIWGES